MVEIATDSLTNLPELRQKTVVGVWLMLIIPDNRLFVFENLVPKFESQKVPGQLNSPAETYKPIDLGNFREGTIIRAIEEEVGEVDYDPTKVKPLGLIRLNIPDKKVVAAPYLIPIDDPSALKYEPKDPNESQNPQWIPLNQVDSQTINFAGSRIPLFRTPMTEIAQLIRDYQKGGSFKVIRSKANLIKKDVYERIGS